MICKYETANKNKGGIKSIKFIDSSKFLGCNFNPSDSTLSDYSLSEGSDFCEISCLEDSAYYLEKTSLDKAHARVSHQLSFSLCDADNQSISLINKILSGSIRGVIALICDNNSKSYLLGYSTQFLNERPLKLKLSSSDSAYTMASRPTTSITLYSEDTSVALEYI